MYVESFQDLWFDGDVTDSYISSWLAEIWVHLFLVPVSFWVPSSFQEMISTSRLGYFVDQNRPRSNTLPELSLIRVPSNESGRFDFSFSRTSTQTSLSTTFYSPSQETLASPSNMAQPPLETYTFSGATPLLQTTLIGNAQFISYCLTTDVVSGKRATTQLWAFDAETECVRQAAEIKFEVGIGPIVCVQDYCLLANDFLVRSKSMFRSRYVHPHFHPVSVFSS